MKKGTSYTPVLIRGIRGGGRGEGGGGIRGGGRGNKGGGRGEGGKILI